ncbi:dirigent protein 22-like [Jatropha curcas]|uniref:dirigent protein 22-like n=1 Tax=Jatropha curcas TaxID=180498 RepID=UPI0009D6C73D|nr:dirigent protein 22-like [Jatropha curcas]
MATRKRPVNFSSTKLIFITILLLAITLANAAGLRETKMTIYLQGFSTGPNATVVAVAGIPGKHLSFTQFGTILVTDDPITETPDINSAQVGRAQGMYATASLDGINSQVSISILFTNTAYCGSILQIQGISKQFDNVRELSVVSGTGRFRYARGYVTFETYFVDKSSVYSVVRCNISVLHY